jgi:hypothetical protein
MNQNGLKSWTFNRVQCDFLVGKKLLQIGHSGKSNEKEETFSGQANPSHWKAGTKNIAAVLQSIQSSQVFM